MAISLSSIVRPLLFDTETTSLISNSLIDDRHKPWIIEFYGMILNADGEVGAELEFHCKPGAPITEEVTRITGIKPEEVANLPPFKHFAQELVDFIGQSGAIVAHNLTYDKAVIECELGRLGMTIEWPKRKICTVEESEWYKGHRLSLTNLHEHLFGQKFEGAHRAKVDVEAMGRCFIEMVRRGDIA